MIGTVIECPLHQGTFDITAGRALAAPASEDLGTYPVEIRDGMIFIRIGNARSRERPTEPE